MNTSEGLNIDLWVGFSIRRRLPCLLATWNSFSDGYLVKPSNYYNHCIIGIGHDVTFSTCDTEICSRNFISRCIFCNFVAEIYVIFSRPIYFANVSSYIGQIGMFLFMTDSY